MASFYIDRNSTDDIYSQWIKHLQANAYVRDIDSIVTQNRQELQTALQFATSEQTKAINQVCGTLDVGFAEINSHLKSINSNISELRLEISEMAAMIDWKLSMLIEEQRITNQLLGNIVQILRIPETQKQRVYHIEQGLKYLKIALSEGIDSSYFTDSFENFKEAEKIEKKDFFTLNRIGFICLYSKQYLNIPLAEEYFLKSAREAYVEAFAGGTTTSNHLSPNGSLSENSFIVATSEAYIYASRACYLQKKLSEAVIYAEKAFDLLPSFLEAGFEQAKYLAANDQENESVKILEKICEKDPYFSIKILQDQDLISRQIVIDFIEKIYRTKSNEANNLLNECRLTNLSRVAAKEVFIEAERLVSNNNLISFIIAIDIIQNKQFKVYSSKGVDDKGNVVRKDGNLQGENFTLLQFVKREITINESKSKTQMTSTSNNKGCALQLILLGIVFIIVLILV